MSAEGAPSGSLGDEVELLVKNPGRNAPDFRTVLSRGATVADVKARLAEEYDDRPAPNCQTVRAQRQAASWLPAAAQAAQHVQLKAACARVAHLRGQGAQGRSCVPARHPEAGAQRAPPRAASARPVKQGLTSVCCRITILAFRTLCMS